jgi:hypothetical protein
MIATLKEIMPSRFSKNRDTKYVVCEDFEDPVAEVVRENARAAMSDNSPIELPSYTDVERENMAAIREREHDE